MNIPVPVNGGGEAPEIEAGLYVAKFIDIGQRVVEQFKTDKDKFGKPDDGTRFDFNVTILDEDLNEVLKPGAEDPTETLDLRQAKSVKVFSSDDRSNSYAYLKGILSPGELALWLASGKGDAAADAAWAAAAEKVPGRLLHVQVGHNEKGWPQIEAFLGAYKAKAK